MEKIEIIIYVPETLNLLNLSGPVQVFKEAADCGVPVNVTFLSNSESMSGYAGLSLNGMKHFSQTSPSEYDYVFICGPNESSRDQQKLNEWLTHIYSIGTKIASVCTGAFVLGHAGLLDGKRCTTHWKYTDRLQETFPASKVMKDQIFIKDGNIYTSAGVAAGIDLSLSILEDEYGPHFACQVARELVVYLRRDGTHTQKSIYLDYRNHIHSGIHKVQDYLINNINKKTNLKELAQIANMSVRNLTRVFRKSAGTNINEFTTEIRIDRAKKLLNNPNLTIDSISAQCGFEDSTQFRRVWKSRFNELPSQFRQFAN